MRRMYGMGLLALVAGMTWCVVPFPVYAATHLAASCSTSDVQAAIDAASNGDTVLIPDGSCAWSSGISTNKQIWIRAQNYTPTDGGATDYLVTITNNNSSSPLFALTTGDDFHVRLSGIRFNEGTGSRNHLVVSGNGAKIALIDDVYMEVKQRNGNQQEVAFIAWTARGGVIWNARFVGLASGAPDGVGPSGGSLWVSNPHRPWTTASTMGMLDTDGTVNLYLENSSCYNIGAFLDGDDHARVVVRHSLLDGCVQLQTHGFTSAWGGRHMEFYNNTFSVTAAYRNHAGRYVWIRLGTFLFTDNVVNNASAPQNYGSINLFVIGDITTPGTYPQPRQPGWGHNGATHVSDPIYSWNNSGARASAWSYANGWESIVEEGRDVFVDQGPKPGYAKYTFPHPARTGNPLPPTTAITQTRVLGVTNTQAVLAYLAPDLSACTVEVSESSSYSPLVHDVDPALFSGADLDTRAGSSVRGRERIVVIGKRTVERAASGAAYSRALQAATAHYYRITCGSDTATGIFQTTTIPLGNSYADEITPDPDNPGETLWQTPLYQRNATWVDPHTGALIKRVTQPGDHNYGASSTNALPSEVLSSTNWTNPNNVLAEDGSSATYDGASCGSACDWLMVNIPSTVAGYQLVERTDIITIKVRGSGSAASSADRTVELCPVQLGTTTIDPNGECQDIVLPQSSLGTVASTPRGLVDTWRKTGKPEWTTALISTTHGHVRFALRKKTATGTISVDAIRRDWFRSFSFTNGSGSSYDRCSSVTRNDDDGPRYLCNAFVASSAGALYSIHAETGDVRFLGLMYRPSTNYAIVNDHFLWDTTNPNRFYSQPSGDPLGAQMFTYSGNGQEKSAGHRAEFDSVQILVGGTISLVAGVKAFVQANSAQYPFLFDDAKFVGCGPVEAQGDYLMLLCRRGSQDSFAWVAAYRISTQAIVAATPMFAAPSARWCTQHYHDPVGNQGVIVEFTQQNKNSGVGDGYYITKLNGAINATQTTIQVTSTCSGSTCAGHVNGEPVSATHADNYLMPAEVGDVFLVNNSEYIRIVQKNSSTEWVVQRNAIGGLGAKSHAHNVDVLARCANKPGAGPTQYYGTPLWVWDYLGDPYGMDATGTYAWMNPYPSHSASRRSFYVGHKSVYIAPDGQHAMRTKDPPWQYGVPAAPHFAGKYPPAGGNTWQHHPNVNQVNASEAERRFFWDIQPFIGGNLILPTTATCNPDNPPYPAAGGCAAARVSGRTKVYLLAVTGSSVNEDGLNPKHLPLFGVAANKVLRDVSGPGSTLDDSAGKDYTICYVVQAGECVSGSTPGQAYVQIPGLSAFYCTGGEVYTGDSDVCVSDFPMMGLSLGQYGVERNKDGVSPSLAPFSTAVGAGWMRDVAKMGLRHGYRTISVFAAGRPLANGKWVMATDWIAGSLIAIVKVPPVVKDTVNRSTFVPIRVQIGSVPRGANNVVVEFGYAERGAPDAYRCTSRAEACVATSATVNEANPFFFASESYSGLACSNGCTVTIPAYPSRVVYYRIRYRDASNQALQQGPLEIAVAP